MKKQADKTVEKKFTMEQAVEELKAKEAAVIQDRKQRLEEFVKLLSEAEEKTNCTIQIDFNSPLNEIRLMPISKI